jgi:hypothetical protein
VAPRCRQARSGPWGACSAHPLASGHHPPRAPSGRPTSQLLSDGPGQHRENDCQRTLRFLTGFFRGHSCGNCAYFLGLQRLKNGTEILSDWSRSRKSLKRSAPQAGFEPATLRLTEPCHRVGPCGSVLFAEGFETGDAVGSGEDRCGRGHRVSPCLNVGDPLPSPAASQMRRGTP